jgi:hypothetical protein
MRRIDEDARENAGEVQGKALHVLLPSGHATEPADLMRERA